MPKGEAVIGYEPVTDSDLQRRQRAGMKNKVSPSWFWEDRFLTGRNQSSGVR